MKLYNGRAGIGEMIGSEGRNMRRAKREVCDKHPIQVTAAKTLLCVVRLSSTQCCSNYTFQEEVHLRLCDREDSSL